MSDKSQNIFIFGNHLTPWLKQYVYSDEKNGVPTDSIVCRKHYAEHVLRYYPDSAIAKHIRSHLQDYEFGNELPAETRKQLCLPMSNDDAPTP